MRGILDDFGYVIDVRIHKDERLCETIHSKSLFYMTKKHKMEKHDVMVAMNVLSKGRKINEIHDCLKNMYLNLLPFYVIMDSKWQFTMQGAKKNIHSSLTEFFTSDMFATAENLRNVLEGNDNMHALKNLTVLNYLHTVFEAIDDYQFFVIHTAEQLGDYCLSHMKNIWSFFVRNVDIFVLGDLLSIGAYSMLSKNLQMPLEQVEMITQRAECDMIDLTQHVKPFHVMTKLTNDSLEPFSICLKKVKRYWKWLRSQADECDTTYAINNDMLFGDMEDDEGKPTICAICLDNAQERSDTWFSLPCRHTFHMECVNIMCTNNLTNCPLCRQCMC
jgi:hypothetical protein